MKKFILLCTATAALTFPACKKKAPDNTNEQKILGKWYPKKAIFLDAGGKELRTEEVSNDCPIPDSQEFSADKTTINTNYTRASSSNADCTKDEQKGTWKIAGNNLSITFSVTTNEVSATHTITLEITTLTDNVLEITSAVQREENMAANVAKVRTYFEKAK